MFYRHIARSRQFRARLAVSITVSYIDRSMFKITGRKLLVWDVGVESDHAVRLQEAWFAPLTALDRSTRIMELIQSFYKTKTKLITVFVCRFYTQCLLNLIEPTISFCAILEACHTAHRAFPNICLCVYVYSTGRSFTIDSPQNRQNSPSHDHRYMHI